MIKYYGVFQLVKVVKEGKTKDGEKIVYFTAASRRNEDNTDFKLFKMYKKNAERFIGNLEKQDNKYKSRKMMIEGYVETYQENQEVICSASVKKDKLPSKYGELIKNFKVEAKTTIKVDRDVYIVNHFEFLDKKGTGDKTVIVDTDEDDDGVYFADDDENELSEAAATADKEITKQKSVEISKNNNEALELLDEMKNNSKFKFNNIQEMM